MERMIDVDKLIEMCSYRAREGRLRVTPELAKEITEDRARRLLSNLLDACEALRNRPASGPTAVIEAYEALAAYYLVARP